ncbi:UNVERIFIED_CONTAM: competence protein ComEC [Acetivibrio alkalicellulosi]
MQKIKLLAVLMITAILVMVSCNVVNQHDEIKEPFETPPAVQIPRDDDEHIKNYLSGIMKIHFIDVGQGDSIFIETPSQNILIDGGNRDDTVINYLKTHDVKKLDIVISTHPHADHIGGLINVLESIHVDEVIDPGVVHTTKTFEDYLTLIDRKDIKFTEGRRGMKRYLGNGAQIEILAPTNPSSDHLNNASIVCRVSFGSFSVMLTGDAERESENEMVESTLSLKSTILKVGHHGSSTSTTKAFLDAVNPEVAVIMCGKDNKYGHPHKETLDKLYTKGIDIYRTDIDGTIIISTDGDTIEINVNKGPHISGTININEASSEDLQKIIHIGPEIAQQIISLRPFESIDDLTRVNGIGQSRLRDIKTEGKAYVYLGGEESESNN